MKAILDTHTFLWGLTDPGKLTSSARHAIASSERYWSVASLWECLLKVQIGKLPLPRSAGAYLVSQMSANGVSILPLNLEHALRAENLPLRHRDPFDRMLIAQSIEEGWPIITADPIFRKYPVRVIW